MADQVVSDAALVPHDEGLPNIADGNEDWGSAGLQMLLSQAVQSGSYARSDTELTFTNHDGANNEVDVTAGVAYLAMTGETVDVQSVLGGSSPPAYDTTITAATLPAICVIVPSTQANLALQDNTLSQVWLAYATDGAVAGVSAGDVYLRSDDTGSVTAPPHPNVELGSVNPDNAGADTLINRFGSPTFENVTVNDTVTAPNVGDGSIAQTLDLGGGSVTDTTQDFVDLTGDGNDLRLGTGQSIEDGSGTGRITFDATFTSIKDDDGTEFVRLSTGFDRLNAYSDKSLILAEDQEGSFTGVQYITSASAPGTLELANARLDFVESVSDTNDSMTANPETDTESGYITVNVNGSPKQIPVYDP